MTAALAVCPVCRGLGEVETDDLAPHTCPLCDGAGEVDAEQVLLDLGAADEDEHPGWYVDLVLAGLCRGVREDLRAVAFEDLRTAVRQVARLETGEIDWQQVDDRLPWCPGVDRRETALGLLIDARDEALARLLGRDAGSVWRAGAVQACKPLAVSR